MTIISFGSINMDLVVRTPRFANPGETLTGRDFYTAAGGRALIRQLLQQNYLGNPS